MALSDSHVLMGEIAGVRGVNGELKVHSWTRPRENILDYPVWTLRRGDEVCDWTLADGGWRGKNLVARFDGIADREAARALLGSHVMVARALMPEAGPEAFYWFELQGLAVETLGGINLGVVSGLIETGANDVLVVRGERERLIPYTPGVHVQSVELDAGRMRVDWDPEF
ncbi:16S rRNA processing protein RimM [Spiribacter vilamensis]|nr:16S rRNA processing protein RimM [Spiribacter vilamensis]